ncbi:MAG: Gfo/Idh/MocA family protein [Planctomycetota bacterium]
MQKPASRREFLGYAATAAAASFLFPSCRADRRRRILTSSDKLNIGLVGVGNRGHDNLRGVASENIIAICDVDDEYLQKAAKEIPGAKKYHDFRDLVRHPGLDAVVVSTADHTHAVAAAAALRANLDVYCEKPLAHNIYEARMLTELARKHGAVTQMGIQIHDHANFRRVVELIQTNAIGIVKDCHVFVNGTNWSGDQRSKTKQDVPKKLNYDLWLGPAAHVPYDANYHPAGWRRYWNFGNGTMGDMACHYMDLAFWALELKYPISAEAKGSEVNDIATPDRLMVNYQFPARGRWPAIPLTWYDAKQRPAILERLGLEKWTNGVLFIGEKGWLIANYDIHELGPKEQFANFERPKPFIPDSIGHHKEWIEACKSRGETSCNFNYSGPLTETVLLGVASYRLGKRIEWDAENLRAKNLAGADKFIRESYRSGWSL